MVILQNCFVSGLNLGYFFEPDKQLFKAWYISKVRETASSKLSQRVDNYIPENKPHIQSLKPSLDLCYVIWSKYLYYIQQLR